MPSCYQATAALFLIATACGGAHDGGDARSAGHATASFATLELSTLLDEFVYVPAAVIVRVDKQAGWQSRQAPELRVLVRAAMIDSADAVTQAFAAADPPQRLIDHPQALAADPGLQSWLSWHASPRYFQPQMLCPYAEEEKSPALQPATEARALALNFGIVDGCQMHLIAQDSPPTYAPVSQVQDANKQQGDHEFWLSYQPWLLWRGMVWNFGANLPSYFDSADAAYYVYEKTPYW